MMKKYFVAAALVLCTCLALSPVVAFAQEVVPNNHSVNVGQLIAPWLEMLLGAVSILITAIVGWIATQIQKRTGIEVEAKHRDALQAALTNAAGLIVAKAQGSLGDRTIDVRHPVIADAITYVNRAAPDAVARFGLTPAQLAEKLVAKLGLVDAGSAKPGPIK